MSEDDSSRITPVPPPLHPRDLLVVTPWYPTADAPSTGAFARDTVRCLRAFFGTITVIHVEALPLGDDRPPAWSVTPEGRILWIGVPMDPAASRADAVLMHRQALTRHALPYLQNSPLIHCHGGVPTGAALVPLIPDTARLVLTEHASYLSELLREPRARELYRAALVRAQVVTAVSHGLARLLDDTFPGARDPVRVIANPLPVDRLPAATAPETDLRRWLYVGNLTEEQGVRRLIRSFAAAVAERAAIELTLTLVGAGPLGDELTQLARTLGVGDRVTVLGPVDPTRIGDLYRSHDLLVHLSGTESTGLSAVEAAASGLSVVASSSGCPVHALALHEVLGLVKMVPVSTDVDTDPVVEAVVSLRHRPDPQASALAREHLRRLCGPETVGAHLNAALTSGPLPPTHVQPGITVMTVALTDKEARLAEATVQTFADFGGSGYFLTTRPLRPDLPPSITVVDISSRERLAFLGRLERTLLGVVARARHRAVSTSRAKSPYDLLWRNLGPALVARSLERDGTLSRLGLQEITCFYLPDEFIIPFAWRCLKHNPALEVRRSWSPHAVALRYADLVLGVGHGH